MSPASDIKPIPTEGKRAPAFTLESTDGEKVRLSAFRGQRVVLYFYPKDATPGCTLEAQEFRDRIPDFEAESVAVFGISPDSIESHLKFCSKQALTFPLLSDADQSVCKEYGLWVEKNMYGRKFWGVQRATFLVGDDGKVLRAWPKVRPKGHAAEVLEAVRTPRT